MSVYIYVLVMAVTVYLLRSFPFVIPLKIKEDSFLSKMIIFIPVACLSSMIFPSIFYSTSTLLSGILGLITAVVASILFKNLFISAISSAVVVAIVEILVM